MKHIRIVLPEDKAEILHDVLSDVLFDYDEGVLKSSSLSSYKEKDMSELTEVFYVVRDSLKKEV